LNYLLNTPEVLGLARSIALPSIGQANLNPGRYTGISIALPPVDEQRWIVSVLDKDRTAVDQISDRLGRQTSLLQEHRQALITAAVTGQLDLVKAAA
jgi:type I restriction enzyme S subunit